VLVHDVGRHAPPDPLVLEVAFGLTPAEARVAARIAAGSTVEAIALANGVSTATVRTQLSQVFAKVGVRRQHELAARLMALPARQGG
jgi:DNA-binding CsgD family transcriptional regulator